MSIFPISPIPPRQSVAFDGEMDSFSHNRSDTIFTSDSESETALNSPDTPFEALIMTFAVASKT